MDFIGEHLMPGRLGHFFVVFSFAASLVATFAYFRAAKSQEPEDRKRWIRLARMAFIGDAAAAFAIFFTIYYIVRQHLFEYNFAWEHSSKSLSVKYLLSCIWEAQEGSFLLWTLWHAVLGCVLIGKAGKWEAPVMTTMSFVQFCLSTMLLGIYFLGFKVGNSPFLLVRQLFSEAPIFSRPDYLSIPQMQDGQGLNALLQNYWMVIHPPILFLGFASGIVPFSFAIAGLWKKDHGGWVKPALPWTLFSACVLGAGIMMGAAWAYESLSFGGYWAWDPVENASLVPWLVIVAGLHTMVIYNATGHSLRASFFFILLGFLLVLYSTFLTRSGILGDTSVHAFVDSGMNLQLVSLILVFLAPAAFLFIREYRHIPHIKKEEESSSREFWMFIGSLILFLSSAFVIIATSLPVINKVAGTKWTVGEDATFAYNRIEIFIAILLGFLTAVTQYLKYRRTEQGSFLKKIGLPTVISLAIAVFISVFGGIKYDKYGAGFLTAIHLGIFGAVYAMVANTAYIWSGLNGKLKAAGASVAHIGFGLMLAGILLSSAKKQVLSYNTTGININFDPSSKENAMENITLLKNVRTDMGNYWATFVNNDSVDDASKTTFYHIRLEKKESKDVFDLYPNLMKATKGQQGFSFNPDKHHYWNRDIFTYISAIENTDKEDTSSFRTFPVGLHDTVFYSNGYMILNHIDINPDNEKYHFKTGDTALMADITVTDKENRRHQARPVFFVKDNAIHYKMDTLFAQNLVVGFTKVLHDKKIELSVKESSGLLPFVSLKVLEFPQINLLWLGTLVMIIGFVMSIARRRKLARLSPERPEAFIRV
jgi:cytochrome c-type biogenesis protein CcmF